MAAGRLHALTAIERYVADGTSSSERIGVMSTSDEWLRQEDARCFEDRLPRLEWLMTASPGAAYWIFPGGPNVKNLFEEARHCFVYAQFMGTILMSMVYIELTLAALFYAGGRDDLERARLSVLLAEARSNGVIGAGEFQDLDRLRSYRNAHAHFRRPGHLDSLETRSVDGTTPHQVIEQDTTAAMATALRLVAKDTVSRWSTQSSDRMRSQPFQKGRRRRKKT